MKLARYKSDVISNLIIYHLILCIFTEGTRAAIHGSRLKSKLSLRANQCSRNYSQQAISLDHLTSQSSRCIALNYPYCLDLELPYRSTTLLGVSSDLSLNSTDEVQTYLQRWHGAKKLPKCWPALRVALCSILMPQCDEDQATGRILRTSKPSVDICHDVVDKGNCRFIGQRFGWPEIFNCSDTNIYSKDCVNELRDLRPSSSAPVCQYPLVPSDDETHWFQDIEGCSLSCKFPISSTIDQYNIGLFIRVMCALGLLTTSSAMVLFKINQAKSKSSTMAKVIQRCNMLQLMNYLGWSMQVFFSSDIACDVNGSALYGLPLIANGCILSFLLTYLPSLSSLFWSAHLGKLCYAKLIGKEKRKAEDKDLNRTLSVLNYGIPSGLFVLVSFLSQIDGNGLHGVCTVGQQSMPIKIAFVFVPLILGTSYANYYFFMTMYKLAPVRSMKPSLKRNYARISALAILSTLQAVLNLSNYVYEYKNRDAWIKSIDEFVACSLNFKSLIREDMELGVTETPHTCSIESKPMIGLYYLELLPMLSIGIVIASWAFCESNLKGFRRKIIDMLEDERDRQRRARAYVDLVDNTALETNRHLTKDFNNIDETYHDLIDLPSPTHTAQAMDLNNNLTNLNELSNHPSLQSCSITELVTNNYSRRHKAVANQPTARDIVNDQRYRQQQADCIRQAGLGNQAQLNLPTITNILEPIIMWQQLQLMSLNRHPDLNGPQMKDSEPQFIHGMTDSKD